MYNIRMHIAEPESSNLSCQVNIRMTPDMREQLETRAKEQWTSASQIARMAVARELDEGQSIVRQRRLAGLELKDKDES